jgi:ABC-type uncharacterized transport system permease subunit
MNRTDLRRSLEAALVFTALVVVFSALCILLAGRNPVTALRMMLGYALGTSDGLAEVVVRTIPLTLAGLGIAVAFRAKVFNIGGDGQIIGGGVACALAAGWLSTLPVWLLMPAVLIAGMIGGGLLGGIAGWLKARYNANEIIVTIMLNYIALQGLGWAIRGPLQERMKIFPRSELLPADAILGILVPDTRIHAGLLVAVIATLVVWVVMRWSVFGFHLRVVGENAAAARFGGIDDRRTILLCLILSGALGGLAGMVEIAGLHHRLQDDFASGFGIAAIAVALLARLQAPLVPLAAFVFGVLNVGSDALQREAGVPFPIVWIIEALVLFGFLFAGWFKARRSRQAVA